MISSLNQDDYLVEQNYIYIFFVLIHRYWFTSLYSPQCHWAQAKRGSVIKWSVQVCVYVYVRVHVCGLRVCTH